MSDKRYLGKSVRVRRADNEVILSEKCPHPVDAFELLADLPEDCFAESREDAPPQSRVTWP